MSPDAVVVPWSAGLTVEDTVGRLALDPRVRAVSFLGSTGTPDWTDHSDVDLCILVDDYAAGLGVETTIIEERIADIVLVDRGRAGEILGHEVPDEEAAAAVSAQEWPYVHWLAEARPVHDPRSEAVTVGVRAARLVRLHSPRDVAEQQAARRFLSHDVRVNSRLLARCADPAMEVALGMRQLHTFVSAVQAWFTARGVGRRGWKKDVARIAEADPLMYELVQTWLAAADVRSRHDIFERAVDRALEPLGGTVPRGRVLQPPDGVWSELSHAR